MTYDCMTEDELALWRAGDDVVAKQTGYHVQKPCTDCPVAFRVAEIAAGRCHRRAPVQVPADGLEYKRLWMRNHRAGVHLGFPAPSLGGII